GTSPAMTPEKWFDISGTCSDAADDEIQPLWRFGESCAHRTPDFSSRSGGYTGAITRLPEPDDDRDQAGVGAMGRAGRRRIETHRRQAGRTARRRGSRSRIQIGFDAAKPEQMTPPAGNSGRRSILFIPLKGAPRRERSLAASFGRTIQDADWHQYHSRT